MTTRRQFLKFSAITAGGFVVPWKLSMAGMPVSPPLDPGVIPRFVDPLPIPAVLEPVGNSKNAASYEVTMTEFQQQVLPTGLVLRPEVDIGAITRIGTDQHLER